MATSLLAIALVILGLTIGKGDFQKIKNTLAYNFSGLLKFIVAIMPYEHPGQFNNFSIGKGDFQKIKNTLAYNFSGLLKFIVAIMPYEHPGQFNNFSIVYS
jgi:hypothetical protein